MAFFKRRRTNERAYQRITSRELVKIQAPNQKNILMSNIMDISEGGIRIIAFTRMNRGDLLNITLNLARLNQRISTQASIRWIKPLKARRNAYLYGISFDNMSKDEIALLRKYLAGEK
jgi:Tfp pilus assembly protein PilZ